MKTIFSRVAALALLLAAAAVTPVAAQTLIQGKAAATCGSESYGVGTTHEVKLNLAGELCGAAPSGGATAVNQVTGNSSLSSLVTAVGAIGDAAWSGTGNGSLDAILKSIYGNTDAVEGSLSTLITNLGSPLQAGGAVTVSGSVAVTGPLTDTQLRASAVPVSLASVPSHAVTNAGTFAVQAAQSGTWNVTNVSGTVSLPTGAATAAKQPALGTAGVSSADVISVQGIASGTALPISGTVTANAGSGTFAISAASLPLPALASTSTKQSDGSQKTQIVDGSGNVIASTSNNLNVQCANCSGSGVSTADEASFTFGTSLFAGSGGFFQTTPTNNALTTGQQGAFQVTANRALFSNLRNAAGTEVGTSTTPLQVSLANTAANGTAVKVDGSAVTQPVSGTVTATGPLTDTQLRATAVPISGTVTANAGTGTFTVSGTVTANAGTNLNTSALALEASLVKLPVAQGSTTSGQSGPLAQGAVTTAAPTYTTAQTSPLSLTTAGALRVDGSAVTQPVSLASVPSHAVTNAGTFAVQATLAAETTKVIGTVNQGTSPWVVSGTVTANLGTVAGLALDTSVDGLEGLTGALTETAPATDTASSGLNGRAQRIAQRLTTINTTLGTPMQATGGTVGLVAGAAAIGTVGVTSIVPGVGATNQGKAEDAAAADGDTGTMALTVRKNTAVATSGTDSDYQPVISNTRGAAWVAIEDGAGGQITSFGGGVEYTEDAAAAADPVGKAIIAVRDDSLGGTITSANGDNIALRANNKGELYVKQTDAVAVTGTFWQATQPVSNAGTFATQSAITAASGAISSGAVASGAYASGAFASGSIASGALASGSIAAGAIAAGATSIADNEDVASADADRGVKILAVRKATPANTSGTDGDYESPQISAGRLWASATIDAALPAGTALIGKVGLDQTTPGTTNAVSLAQIGGTTIVNGGVAGSQSVGGTVATNVAITANPLNLGAQAVSSENTAVTTARQVQLVADLVGKLIVLPYSNPENFVSGVITSAMTGTTTTSLIAAPAAGLRNYITQLTCSNGHATVGTDIIVQDGSGGTTFYVLPAASGFGGAAITFPTPLRQPTTATAVFVANVTTGASTKCAASGYKGS